MARGRGVLVVVAAIALFCQLSSPAAPSARLFAAIAPISEGSQVPSVTFKTRTRTTEQVENPFDWKDVTSEDIFKGKRVWTVLEHICSCLLAVHVEDYTNCNWQVLLGLQKKPRCGSLCAARCFHPNLLQHAPAGLRVQVSKHC